MNYSASQSSHVDDDWLHFAWLCSKLSRMTSHSDLFLTQHAANDSPLCLHSSLSLLLSISLSLFHFCLTLSPILSFQAPPPLTSVVSWKQFLTDGADRQSARQPGSQWAFVFNPITHHGSIIIVDDVPGIRPFTSWLACYIYSNNWRLGGWVGR